MSEIILLDRFFKQIHMHLVSCYCDVPRWPVILGIFGRSGDGKSAQLSTSLERCGVEIVRLNAADLESGLAGEPGKYVARTYAAASMAIDKQLPAALVVDDFDTTVGEWEMNTGTVNHQQVLAELMHLADQPADKTRALPQRVPIFITGNNLLRLYPPLRRHGRMNIFAWQPEPQEVREVVTGIFADVADRSASGALASAFVTEPLSFFAQVRQELLYDEMARFTERAGRDMREFLRRKGRNQFTGARGRVADAELLQIAKRVYADRQAALQDFLQGDWHRGGSE